MTSSRMQAPTHTTGAHRAHRRAPHASAQRPAARYEPHLDGLFTYCLSVLCDHDAATEALGAVLAIADRHEARCPEAEEERQSWLYALARWTCLRTLTERRRGRQAHRRPPPAPTRGAGPAEHTSAAVKGRPGAVQGPSAAAEGHEGARLTPEGARLTHGGAHLTPEDATTPDPTESPAAEARRRELATLAWPEAAGTTPEQREALELAVRHRLTPRAVASVLGLEPVTARELLAAAACEVERTRAALAVVETADCPTVARLTGDHQVLLSAALRRELVRHVDDCPRCRRAAERVDAAGPWPGATVAPATARLPLVEAPRPSVHVALAQARRSRSGGPRFGRTGYPLDPKDHAARRDRLRARVVTTTVVATVVAAPVIALWAAYRGAPLTGEGHDGSKVTATEIEGAEEAGDDPGTPYEKTGNARPGDRHGVRTPDVTAEVVSTGGDRESAGRLTVAVRTSGALTTITLTASARGPVDWTATTDARWLRLSRTAGTLAAGKSATVTVAVNHAAAPRSPWRARIALDPSGSAVIIDGRGATAPPPGTTPGPTRPAPGSPDPTDGTGPRPTDPGPTDPGPGPSPTDPGPSDPGPTDPGPGPTDPAPTDPTPTDPAPTDPTDPPDPDPTDPPPTDPGPSDPGPTE
ncbi:BACON domain-containing protein [Streptomyces arboris]|uniref:BACON domain-containing protein n=1 Tax=Streptomyces arboris TaxID=2600619 RepID=UPI003C302D09